MKTQNYRGPENRIFNKMLVQGDFDQNLTQNPKFSETNDLHQINLPDNKLIEIWYEDSIAPVKLNEYQNISSIHINKRSNCCQGNTFETKPFSEIYNMVVMRDSF